MTKRRGNITSANASGVLIVEDLFPSGITLDNYATDAALAMDEETIAETRMGVDGKMAAGYVPSIKVLTLSLEPFSAACQALDIVVGRSHRDREVYYCTMIFTIPALREIWTFNDGVIKTLKSIPDVKKVLDMRTFKFDFESFDPRSY